MKILITGGHFSPAYSLIQELKKRDFEVALVGRKFALEADNNESLEYLISKKENIEFFELSTGRLQRKLTPNTLPSLAKIPSGLFNSLKILRKYKPDVVMTFGGYLGVPIAFAAKILGIPVLLHEQTQIAGVAARAIAPFASKILVSFNSSRKYFPQGKTIVTGNPLRREIFEVQEKIKIPEGKVIYVTGGSTGSHFINSVISDVLENLLEEFIVIHQSGESREYGDYKKLTDQRNSLPQNLKSKYILRKFIYPNEIGFVLKNADIIVTRAGANTVSEIIALKKMALLIPLPGGQHDEQLKNAILVRDEGFGEYIEQKNADSKLVLQKIKDMLDNKDKHGKNAKSQNVESETNATANIIREIEKVYAEKKS